MARRGNERNEAYANAGYANATLRRRNTEAARNDRTRLNRARDIASRYTRNIAQSKAFTNDYKGRGLDAARNRQYSQNTYMGANNG